MCQALTKRQQCPRTVVAHECHFVVLALVILPVVCISCLGAWAMRPVRTWARKYSLQGRACLRSLVSVQIVVSSDISGFRPSSISHCDALQDVTTSTTMYPVYRYTVGCGKPVCYNNECSLSYAKALCPHLTFASLK